MIARLRRSREKPRRVRHHQRCRGCGRKIAEGERSRRIRVSLGHVTVCEECGK